MDELDHYLNIIIGKDAGIIFLCVVGAVLNSVMLYMLLSKKQVRSSVHTVYMVQIALTDLLVCLVWLILTSVIMHNLLQTRTASDEYEQVIQSSNRANASSTYAKVLAHQESSHSQYRSWRIMYSWYNFHYYTNILLLASMSVERCAAVWKSMRCQRYHYNKNFIIGVSACMWIVAFAFILPNLINPDLMVSDSDSPNGVSRTIESGDDAPTVNPEEWKAKPSEALSEVFNGRHTKGIFVDDVTIKNRHSIRQDPLARPYEDESKNYNHDMDILYECYFIMSRTLNKNDDYVKSHGKVTVDGCVGEIFAIIGAYDTKSVVDYANYYSNLDQADYGGGFGSLHTGDPKLPNSVGLDYEAYLSPYGILDENTDELIAVQRHMYQSLLTDAVMALMSHHQTFRASRNQACDPDLSHAAQIYVLVVNLALGFFVPFVIIVFSYVSIAYMIGKRAKRRMNAAESSAFLGRRTTANIGPETRQSRPSVGRRMSDFMRIWFLRQPRSDAESRSYYTGIDRESTPFETVQKSSSFKQCDESGPTRAQFDKKKSYRPIPKAPEDLDQQNTNPVRMRNDAIPRIQKSSFCHDSASDNVPETIEEHPCEVQVEVKRNHFPGVNDKTSCNDTSFLTVPSWRGSRSSYGSSMDSMATEQTSASLHDKIHSASTPSPRTATQAFSPSPNHFFSNSEDEAAQSLGIRCEQLPEHQKYRQISSRKHSPGSELDGVALKQENNSCRVVCTENSDLDMRPPSKDSDATPADLNDAPESDWHLPSQGQRPYPRILRSISAPADRSSPFNMCSQSSANSTCERLRVPKAEVQGSRRSLTQQPNRASNSRFTAVRTHSTISKSNAAEGNTLRKTVAHRNAERHLRVSRTVLAYVIVFSICWLPQRITYLLYVIKALIGASNAACIKLISAVRLLSFVSVLLNPIVSIFTQREFQNYVRKSVCVTKIRRWYEKCTRKTAARRESNVADKRQLATSRRGDEMELQDLQMSGNLWGTSSRSPISRTKSSSNANFQVRRSPGVKRHDMFLPSGGMYPRKPAATIDEMKEEEAAAEKSLQMEMQGHAVERERHQDCANRNILDPSKCDKPSLEKTVGSDKNITCSNSNSKNWEEFSKHFLESGVASKLLSSQNGDREGSNVSTAAGPRLPALKKSEQSSVLNDMNQERFAAMMASENDSH